MSSMQLDADSPADLDLRRSRPRELSALAELFWLTLRQHTRGRRWLVLLLLYALPCGLAILLRSLSRPAPAWALETALVFHLIPHALGPLTALLYAGGLIQDEVEEQTLTYLLLRPLPRWGIYVVKLLATLVTTILLIGIFTVVLYICIYWGTPELWGEIIPGRAFKTAVLFALAQIAYCSLFGCVGLLTRRTLIAGVCYIVACEGVLANLDFVGRTLTVVYYLRVLVLRWLGLPAELQSRFQREWGLQPEEMPEASACVRILLVASLLLTILAALWFTRKEFRMKTPEGS
jgi:ABC-2 type transport system permease protein